TSAGTTARPSVLEATPAGVGPRQFRPPPGYTLRPDAHLAHSDAVGGPPRRGGGAGRGALLGALRRHPGAMVEGHGRLHHLPAAAPAHRAGGAEAGARDLDGGARLAVEDGEPGVPGEPPGRGPGAQDLPLPGAGRAPRGARPAHRGEREHHRAVVKLYFFFALS